MKKLLPLLFSIFFTTLIVAPIHSSFGQVQLAKDAESQILKAINKKGVVIKKSVEYLGEYGSLVYFHTVVEDLSTSVKYKGLNITTGTGFAGLRKEAFVDADELKTLLIGLERIRDERLDPKIAVNYKFISKGGFHIDQSWTLEKNWYMAAYFESTKETPIIFKEIVDIFYMITMVQKAIAK